MEKRKSRSNWERRTVTPALAILRPEGTVAYIGGSDTLPAPLTREEEREWLNQMDGVALGSDAFFPFDDNVERAHRSGVKYIAQPGGSIRDDLVIEACNKYGIVMYFTGMRLFHH